MGVQLGRPWAPHRRGSDNGRGSSLCSLLSRYQGRGVSDARHLVPLRLGTGAERCLVHRFPPPRCQPSLHLDRRDHVTLSYSSLRVWRRRPRRQDGRRLRL